VQNYTLNGTILLGPGGSISTSNTLFYVNGSLIANSSLAALSLDSSQLILSGNLVLGNSSNLGFLGQGALIQVSGCVELSGNLSVSLGPRQFQGVPRGELVLMKFACSTGKSLSFIPFFEPYLTKLLLPSRFLPLNTLT
jgi:hypothetical protein